MAAARRSRATTVQEGESLLGYKVKLYPTQEQLHYLGSCQVELMSAWSELCTSRSTHYDHMVRRAEDDGVTGPIPPRPTSDRYMQAPTRRSQVVKART